jgi:acyl carrier protein
MLRHSNEVDHHGFALIDAASQCPGGIVMSIRELIQQQFARTAKSRNRTLPPLTDNLRLADTGLDSLSFAVIVAQLEDVLLFDPFNDAIVRFPATFGDFVRLYENRQP